MVIVTSCGFAFLFLVVFIVVVLLLRKRQKYPEETEGVDANPDYGSEYYDLRRTEVKDNNDYYLSEIE